MACHKTPVCPGGPAIRAIITLNRSVCASSLQPYCGRESSCTRAGMSTDQIAALRPDVLQPLRLFIYLRIFTSFARTLKLSSRQDVWSGGGCRKSRASPSPFPPFHSTQTEQASERRACTRKAGMQAATGIRRHSALCRKGTPKRLEGNRVDRERTRF